ncbi:hypothetical protein [Acuticoccus mangrovi]|uniref:Lipoprotein n=1 Tax=Acuticoccus mangrovi TaxID=2796142 RepID=A0A934IU32_9HYPH|nr:hypothetical protein [Acuticoccus mangrovi]MBJ3778851.1 hypothetical protein [Acuticoccus mangrovi]
MQATGRRSTIALGLVALAVTLAGCGGSGSAAGGPSATSAVGTFFRGTNQEPTSVSIDASPAVCPRVRIQPQTEVLRRGDESDTDGSKLRWQASITRTARECANGEGGGIVTRIGVSGRVVLGPRGEAGTVELPLRMAVREGDTVTYSRVHNVSVKVEGASAPWAYVEENVKIADPGNAEIIVGFDG